MAGWTSTASLTNVINTIRAKSIFTMQDFGVFPGVVDRVSVPSGNRSYTEPKIGTLTAYALTEGVDMEQGQVLTDSLMTVTPTEVGVQCLYTRLAEKTHSESIVSLITRAMTDALKKKQDQDGCALGDGFSVSFGAGSGTTLSTGYLSAARAQIRGNSTELSNDPVTAIVHPFTYNDLVDAYTTKLFATGGTIDVGFGGLSEEFARKYVVGTLAGMPIVTDSNFTIGSSAAKGMVMTKNATVYAELWGVDVQPDADPSARGTEINATMCYAYGERTDTHGVELNLAAASPTA